MGVSSLKNWKLDNGVYVSPRFDQFATFNRAKRFFIRAQVVIHCDETGRVIKIPTKEKTGKANLEILKQLKLIAES